jgi:hypothetical protein
MTPEQAARLAAARPPPWADPAREVTPPPARRRDDAEWTGRLLTLLAALPLSTWQRYELAAISALETGWFDSPAVELNNWGGSKLKEDIAARYLRRHGRPMRFFRALGHVKSGDQPVVWYAVWDSALQYWTDWLARHVGTGPGVEPLAATYAEAGRRFWTQDPTWIAALIEGGYRGTVTKAKPAGSIAGHRAIVARCMRLTTH